MGYLKFFGFIFVKPWLTFEKSLIHLFELCSWSTERKGRERRRPSALTFHHHFLTKRASLITVGKQIRRSGLRGRH